MCRVAGMMARAENVTATRNAVVYPALVMTAPRTDDPAACPSTSAMNRRAVPAAAFPGLKAVVHEMRADVPAVKPHPNSTQAITVAMADEVASVSAKIVAARTRQLIVHAVVGARRAMSRDVGITAVAPIPSAIHATIVPWELWPPESTRRLRP